MCDYTTVDAENDILLEDAIRRDRVEEISTLHYNENHKWYYLKDQGIDDLLVFRNVDSHDEKPRKYNSRNQIMLSASRLRTNILMSRTGAFHAAVNNPLARGPRRESVEVRVVAIL